MHRWVGLLPGEARSSNCATDQVRAGICVGLGGSREDYRRLRGELGAVNRGHFGVDSRTKLIHTVAATPANVADGTVLTELLHGQETRVWGDQAYRRPARDDPGACAAQKATINLEYLRVKYQLSNEIKFLGLMISRAGWIGRTALG